MATIYHYTDAAGLLGIIKGSLWLTHIEYLNDSLEYKYAKELYQKALEELFSDAGEATQTMRLEQQQILDAIKLALKYLKSGIYVASFSKKYDDLGQWRAYSGSGARYCIGFDTDKILRLDTPPSPVPSAILQNVVYGERNSIKRAKSNYIEAFNSKHADRTAHLQVPLSDTPVNPIIGGSKAHAGVHWSALAKFAAWCKHDAFENEEEWRLAIPSANWMGDLPAEMVHHRQGRSFIVPYVEIQIKQPECPIISVTTGPCAHPDLAEKAVRSLLRSNHLDSVVNDVNQSKVPFRDW